MLKTLTLVKMRSGWSRDDFFQRWCEHTRDWDLRDHPEICLNRLMMVEGDFSFVGIAENHWPDKTSLEAAVAWYATPEGQAHWRDLNEFMDVENSVTVTVSGEALVEASRGVVLL